MYKIVDLNGDLWYVWREEVIDENDGSFRQVLLYNWNRLTVNERMNVMKRMMSVVVAIMLAINVLTPVASAVVSSTQMPDGKIPTNYSNIFLDNNGEYYACSEGKVTYLEQVTFTSADVSAVYDVAEVYNLPQEVKEKLVMAVETIVPGHEVSVFIPVSNSVTRAGTYWSDVYTLTYQGVTFTLQDYYVATDKSTGTHRIDSGAKSAATAENIVNFSVWCADVTLGVLAISSVSPMSLLAIFVNAGLNSLMTGSAQDYVEACAAYTLTERMTYVKDSNGWTLKYISTAPVLKEIMWHFFVANESSSRQNVWDNKTYNQVFYSQNYYDAPTKAVCASSTMTDSPVYIRIGSKTLLMT